MSHFWLLCLLPRGVWEDPRKPFTWAFPFPGEGLLLGNEEGGVRGPRKPVSHGQTRGDWATRRGGSGSEAHLVCVRFIRLIANKGIRANLLI